MTKSKMPEYKVWINIKDYCYNKNSNRYKDVGLRGIKLCDRWLIFNNFLNDVGLRPDPKMVFVRINRDVDYCPENCKWMYEKEYRTILYSTHGMVDSSEYSSWISMKRRCLDENHDSYKNYGGRGITIYQEWIDSFENFYEYMGPKPDSSYQIDRIDNNGNYEPGNCKWSSLKEQNNNKRNTVFIEFRGEYKSLSEWSEILKMNKPLLRERLKRMAPE